MPIHPEIIRGLRSIQMPDPVARQRNILDIQNAERQRQLGDLQIQDQQLKMGDDAKKRQTAERIYKVLEESGGTIDDKAVAAIMAISPEHGQHYQTYLDSQKKGRIEEDTAGREVDLENLKLTDGQVAPMTGETPPIDQMGGLKLPRQPDIEVPPPPANIRGIRDYSVPDVSVPRKSAQQLFREKKVAAAEARDKAIFDASLKKPDGSLQPFEVWHQQNPDAPIEDWLQVEQGAKPQPRVPVDQQALDAYLKSHPGKTAFDFSQLKGQSGNAETEFDKRLKLFRSDRDTYDHLYGRNDQPPTATAKAAIVQRILAHIRSEGLSGQEAEDTYEVERGLMRGAGVDIPPYRGTAGGAASGLPKPPQPGAPADDATIDAYLKANGGDQRKAIQALEDAGWK